MTALAIKTQNFLSRVINNLIEARARSAEVEVAKMLQREYPSESVDHILHLIRLGKTEELGQ